MGLQLSFCVCAARTAVLSATTVLCADPAVAISVGFKYDPNVDIAGGSNDWMYSDRGILAYCTVNFCAKSHVNRNVNFVTRQKR